MKYLFWNTHKNDDINDVLSELIIENNISMVLLAEYAANADELINKLAARDIDMLQYGSCSERIKMFGRIENIQYRMDSDHAVIRIINDKDILCCIHLNSKIYSDHEEIREIHNGSDYKRHSKCREGTTVRKYDCKLAILTLNPI